MLTQTLQAAARGEHLFFDKAAEPRTVVIDFSSPNVAKPMHVGHIRSTILGDCLARTLRLLGHRVITDNHIGDWGLQFGLLIVGWKKHLNREALKADPLGEMERLYKLVFAASKADEKVLDEARQELVKLQRREPENLGIWQEMRDLSLSQFSSIYDRLGVKFDHTYGESHYNARLEFLVQDLIAEGIARESEGAIVVFFEDVPRLKEQPLIIRKSDGGFNYATTDLATLEFRLDSWKPNEIIYVTDGRQQLHFQQVFTVFHKWRQANSELRDFEPGTQIGSCLVRFDSGRGREAVQNPQRRDGEAGRFARRGGRPEPSKLFPGKIRICRRRTAAKSRASSVSAR